MGIVTSRGSQVQGVGVEIAVAPLTSMLGVGHYDGARTLSLKIPDIVQVPFATTVPVRKPLALWTGATGIVAGLSLDNGLGQILG